MKHLVHGATDGGGTLPSSTGKLMRAAKQGAEESDRFDFVIRFRHKFQPLNATNHRTSKRWATRSMHPWHPAVTYKHRAVLARPLSDDSACITQEKALVEVTHASGSTHLHNPVPPSFTRMVSLPGTIDRTFNFRQIPARAPPACSRSLLSTERFSSRPRCHRGASSCAPAIDRLVHRKRVRVAQTKRQVS